MKKTLWLLLLFIPLLCGCAKAPVTVEYYQPAATSPGQKIAAEGNFLFISQADDDHAVKAMLTGGDNVLVVYLQIDNKTGANLDAADYSVRLTDGPDRLPLPLISREVVMAYRAQVAAGDKIASGNSIADAALMQLDSMVKNMGSTEIAQFLTSMNWAIDHYFAFRPVYAHRNRAGVLCYYINFIREYPLILSVKIKDKTVNFDFLPIKGKP